MDSRKLSGDELADYLNREPTLLKVQSQAMSRSGVSLSPRLNAEELYRIHLMSKVEFDDYLLDLVTRAAKKHLHTIGYTTPHRTNMNGYANGHDATTNGTPALRDSLPVMGSIDHNMPAERVERLEEYRSYRETFPTYLRL